MSIFKLIKPADIVSLTNAFLGFASIILASKAQIENALLLILVCVILDGLDGAVARRYGSGVLGVQLDSLADAISFGVAPAFLAFTFINSNIVIIFSGIFLLCGILRLARFNVIKTDGFEGIPITSGGLVVVLFLLMKDYVPYIEYSIVILFGILSYLMISTIPYPKIKNPIILALPACFLVFDILAFYIYPSGVKTISLILFVLIGLYILSPLKRFYDRNK